MTRPKTYVDDDVLIRIQELVRESRLTLRRDPSAPYLKRRLDEDDELKARAPRDLRTYRKILADMADDQTGEWSLAAASSEDAAAVLRIIGLIATWSQGRGTTVTKGEAVWITKLTKLCDSLDVPSTILWRLVQEYNEHSIKKTSTAAFDLWLGLKPWLASDSGKAFIETLEAVDVPNRDRQVVYRLADQMANPEEFAEHARAH